MHLFCDLPHDSIEDLHAENTTLTRRLANSTRIQRARNGQLAVLREEIHRLQKRVRNLRRSNSGLRLASKELLPQRTKEAEDHLAEYSYMGGKTVTTPPRPFTGAGKDLVCIPEDTPTPQRIPEAEDHLLVYPYGQPALVPDRIPYPSGLIGGDHPLYGLALGGYYCPTLAPESGNISPLPAPEPPLPPGAYPTGWCVICQANH